MFIRTAGIYWYYLKKSDNTTQTEKRDLWEKTKGLLYGII